jgi:hypothetical protein
VRLRPLRPFEGADEAGGHGGDEEPPPFAPDDADVSAFADAYERIRDPKHRAFVRWLVFGLGEEGL